MTLYEKIIRAPEKIRWMDVFSDAGKKHDKKDTEYAFIAGTTLDSANAQNMLQKWRTPWLFYRMGLAGLALGVLMYALQFLLLTMGVNAMDYGQFIAYIVPMIVPMVLMVFFWELNVPRNISIIELFGCFLCGAAICFFVTFALGLFIPDPYVSFERFGAGTTDFLYKEGFFFKWASTAALREEPAKLAAAALILYYLSTRGKKEIYGFTGLVVGAAVGAAFSAYESIMFGLDYGTENVLLRAILAVGGHVLYCAPYTAVLALNMKNNRLTADSFMNREFALSFGFSILMHMVWNCGISEYIWYLSVMPGKARAFQDLFLWIMDEGNGGSAAIMVELIKRLEYPKIIAVIALLWFDTLMVVRKCFAQVGSKVTVSTASSSSSAFIILGTGGVFAGKQFSIKSNEVFIGSDGDMKLCYPVGTPGIEGRHSELLIRNGHLYLADLGTVSGTYINGKRIPPKQGHLLSPGDTFYIGSPQEAFKLM